MNKQVVTLILALTWSLGCAAGHTRLEDHQNLDASRGGAEGEVDWPSVSNASQMNAQPNDVAIVIGIEDYVFLPDVVGARQTAMDWASFFRDSLGTQNVFMVLDQDATKEGILRTTAKALSVTSPGSKLWFVFVGHGAPSEDGEGLLVGADAQQNYDSLKARAITQDKVLAWMKSSKSSSQVVLLDACFSGRARSGELLAKGTQPVIPSQRQIQTPSGTVILTAAQGDELAGSLPNSSRPAFSYLALGALRGWAADDHGSVTAASLTNYATTQLRYVPSRTQTPSLHGMSGLVLTQATQEADPGIANLMAGIRPQAPKSSGRASAPTSRTYDSGFGLYLNYSNRWSPAPLHEGDFGEKSDTIARFDHTLSGGDLVIQRTPNGDNYFKQNLQTLHSAWLKMGAIMIESRDFNGGILREYQYKDLNVVMWYGTGADALWTVGGPVPKNERQVFLTDLELLIESVYFD